MGVHLTKIYTKTGDSGLTALGNNYRVPKQSARIQALGDIDEANAAIGVAILYVKDDLTRVDLMRLQNHLFDLGGTVCTPGLEFNPGRGLISFYESRIDHYLEKQEPLNSFILPGGSPASAHLHLARTIIRRAERSLWQLVDEEKDGTLGAKFLNRVSDLLFVMGRDENTEGDVLWRPINHES